uniref:receptor protein-tyrosine kinase n=1 Tax=Saccoglossus kowalevskii TaxID=10224 RepID=A0ABM0MDM8_SACKO|nr:PREDICTED: tyrosine kinase receptor Cad96Ca-like [Saccoglossus kowalevskii]
MAVLVVVYLLTIFTKMHAWECPLITDQKKVELIIDNSLVRRGESVKMECVDENTDVKYRWNFKGNNDTTYRLLANKYNIYPIFNLSDVDCGYYTCQTYTDCGMSPMSNIVHLQLQDIMAMIPPPQGGSSEDSISLLAISIIAGSIVASMTTAVFLIIIGHNKYMQNKNKEHSENRQVIEQSRRDQEGLHTREHLSVDGSHQNEEHRSENDVDIQTLANFSHAKSCEVLQPLICDEWEFPRQMLHFQGMLLGQGEFGEVQLAYAVDPSDGDKQTKVAVKYLRKNATDVDRKDFLQELRLMKTFTSAHPNVVSLFGCCTSSDPVYIILEFVKNGCLQNHLRASHSALIYQNLHQNVKNVSSWDLLHFGWQVAKGMSFLASMKCIHRDLATRNILLDENNTCKISDFGFARDVKGSTPYGTMPSAQVINEINRGYRLPRPTHCSRELYDIMVGCWNVQQEERPTFSQLCSRVGKLAENHRREYLHLDMFEENLYVNIDNNHNDEKL